MLPLPPGSEDPRELADWLELNAFLNKDGQASLDDLRDALRSGVLGYETGTAPQEQPEQLEQVAANVVVEISDRQRQSSLRISFQTTEKLAGANHPSQPRIFINVCFLPNVVVPAVGSTTDG